jgi:methionyl-tRNA synthetase
LALHPSKKNVLITSALPYVNNVPHLGNLIGSVLSADAYSRYCRLRGLNSLFICGTDEFGTATEHAAAKAGLTPKALCDKYFGLHKQIYDWFDIDFDCFGRTSAPFHRLIAQDMFLALHRNGSLLEREREQTYCPKCEVFLADRYVTGKCPSCGSSNARGDQCEDCSALLDPSELVEPQCSVCRSTPEPRKSTHFYLDLSQFESQLAQIAETSCWSPNALSITKAWLSEGLEPRCITRDLQWGTPVPVDKYQGKVLYVWFDAPIGYISITAGHTPHWTDWWTQSDVKLVQFMGKDNVPFHTVLFPATLIGSGMWSRSPHISTTEYLNFEGGKFSKSRGTGIFGDDAMASGIPAEVWRYYLLSTRPEHSDANFSLNDLALKTNSELLANLGNLCNRVLKFIEKTGSTVQPPGELQPQDLLLVQRVKDNLAVYDAKFEKLQLKAALKTSMEIATDCNRYFQAEQPWAETDSLRVQTTMFVLVNLLQVLGVLLEPFIPAFSEKLYSQLNTVRPPECLEVLLNSTPTELLRQISAGHVLGKASPLISKST